MSARKETEISTAAGSTAYEAATSRGEAAWFAFQLALVCGLLVGGVVAYAHRAQFSFWWWPAGSVVTGLVLCVIDVRRPGAEDGPPSPGYVQLVKEAEPIVPMGIGMFTAACLIVWHLV